MTARYKCPYLNNEEHETIYEGSKPMPGTLIRLSPDCKRYLYSQTCDEDPDCGLAEIVKISAFKETEKI